MFFEGRLLLEQYWKHADWGAFCSQVSSWKCTPKPWPQGFRWWRSPFPGRAALEDWRRAVPPFAAPSAPAPAPLSSLPGSDVGWRGDPQRHRDFSARVSVPVPFRSLGMPFGYQRSQSIRWGQAPWTAQAAVLPTRSGSFVEQMCACPRGSSGICVHSSFIKAVISLTFPVTQTEMLSPRHLTFGTCRLTRACCCSDSKTRRTA